MSVPSTEGQFTEAIKFFASKEILHPDKFYDLAAEARVNAFTVSGVTNLRVLKDLHAEVEKVLTDGGTVKTFQEGFNDILRNSGYAPANPRHIEIVFRQNIQTSYSVGRYGKQMERAELRPWWTYNSIDDSGTTPLCYELGGHGGSPAACYRYDHPFWSKFYPPNHFGCRSGVDDLSDDELAEAGITPMSEDITGKEYFPVMPDGSISTEPEKLLPPEQFAVNPGKVAWEPDWSKFTDDERQIFDRAYEERFGPVRTMDQLQDRLTGLQDNFKLMGVETSPIEKIVEVKSRGPASGVIDLSPQSADVVKNILSSGKLSSQEDADVCLDLVTEFSKFIGKKPDLSRMESDSDYAEQIFSVNRSWSRLFFQSFCDSCKLQNAAPWADKIVQGLPFNIDGVNMQDLTDMIWNIKLNGDPGDYGKLLQDGIKKISSTT